MKLLQKLFGFISLVLMLGGVIVFSWEYFRNKTTFNILFANSVVKGVLPVLKNMAFALLALIVGLLFFSVYLKIAGSVRKSEREKQVALQAEQRMKEEDARKLRQEAEEAKAEAEEAKKENERMRMTFMRTKDEETENKEEGE